MKAPAKFKVGDDVISICRTRGPQTGYGAELIVMEVDSFGPEDNYYHTTNGGCFHERDSDLVSKEAFNSPLYKALR